MLSSSIRILFFALPLSISPYALSGSLGVKIISYNINASIRSLGDPVEVSLTCELQKSDTVSQIEFLFSSTILVQSIQFSLKNKWGYVPFEFTGKDTIQLQLPLEARSLNCLSLKFVYRFPNLLQGDTLLLLDRGHRWYPLIIDQIAGFTMTADVPAGYTVLSAGNILESKTSGGRSRFVWQSVFPVFKLPLIVFRSDLFKMTSRVCADKTIMLYSYMNDTFKSSCILAEAENVFNFYQNYIGEYHHKRLTLIEVPDFEGINVGSGLLTVGSASLNQMKQGNFDMLHLTIAQQWIGAGIFAKFGEPGFWFLALSLPHYLRLTYIRHTKGKDAFNEAMHQPLTKYLEFAGKENDIPIIGIDFPNSKEKGLVLYAKGPFVISKLQKQIGEEGWQSFMCDLSRDFNGKILSYNEFQDELLKHDTSGGVLVLLHKLMTEKGVPAE